MTKIAIGSDHNAFALKENIKAYLIEKGVKPVDFGCNASTTLVDYPDVALDLAEGVSRNEYEGEYYTVEQA